MKTAVVVPYDLHLPRATEVTEGEWSKVVLVNEDDLPHGCKKLASGSAFAGAALGHIDQAPAEEWDEFVGLVCYDLLPKAAWQGYLKKQIIAIPNGWRKYIFFDVYTIPSPVGKGGYDVLLVVSTSDSLTGGSYIELSPCDASLVVEMNTTTIPYFPEHYSLSWPLWEALNDAYEEGREFSSVAEAIEVLAKEGKVVDYDGHSLSRESVLELFWEFFSDYAEKPFDGDVLKDMRTNVVEPEATRVLAEDIIENDILNVSWIECVHTGLVKHSLVERGENKRLGLVKHPLVEWLDRVGKGECSIKQITLPPLCRECGGARFVPAYDGGNGFEACHTCLGEGVLPKP